MFVLQVVRAHDAWMMCDSLRKIWIFMGRTATHLKTKTKTFRKRLEMRYSTPRLGPSLVIWIRRRSITLRKVSLNYNNLSNLPVTITVKESQLNYNFKYTNLNPTWGTDRHRHSFIPQQNNQWLNSNKLHCKMIRKLSSYAKHQTKAY